MTLARAAFRTLACLALAPIVMATAAQLSPAEQAAAFEAAGFKRHGDQWRACEDPTPTYTAGAIETVRDLNGDGRPEAVITEGGTFCYGHAGTGFVLVSQQADGSWKQMYAAPGMADFLATKGAGGWPDIQVGGPGFCFPVVRWNGSAYELERHEYEGKPCRAD